MIREIITNRADTMKAMNMAVMEVEIIMAVKRSQTIKLLFEG